MSKPPRVAHIVSHTHWDREWYRTFHTYRVWLCRAVRSVLEALERDPAFRHFLLDGQAVILEDYLEIHPEDEERIREHVRAGRLSIGPWYILPDEFLVSAEATIRNLLIGDKVCRRLGGRNCVGYMPDSFGHVAQMPQILRQAGLDSFVYWRGNGDELDDLGIEYLWEAPDGSQVLAINQWGGYCSAASLGHREIWHAHTRKRIDLDVASQRVAGLLKEIAARSSSGVALLNNGCDHFPPQRDFAEVIERLRRDFPDVTFKHSSLSAYLEDARAAKPALATFRGELMSGKLAHVLSGVWSARMYLKQLNDRCQRILVSQWEPLSAYTHFMLGRDYPAGLIDHAWRLLLKNHPHDSICGCSIDEVHRDMLPRFGGVIDTAEESIVRQMEALAPEFARDDRGDADTVLCVVNSLPRARSAVIERLVILQPCCADVGTLRLLDSEEREVPFKIIDVQHVERFWGVDYRLHLNAEEQIERFQVYRRDFGPRILKERIETQYTDRYVLLQFLADDLPAVGHANYRFTDKPAGGRVGLPHEPVRIDGSTIENPFCRVAVHPNGTFDLLHKPSGRTWRGLNLLEDTEDVGDEYDYSPCEAIQTVTSADAAGQISIHRNTHLSGVLEAAFNLALPSEIRPDRKARSEGRTACAVTIRIGLNAFEPVVDIDVCFENGAKDHRLRAHFPAGMCTGMIVSDGHFYVNERPIRRPTGESWVQPSPRTYPQQDFSLLQDESGGLAIFNRGLPEIEPIEDETGGVGLALTLLRCVGWLSRDDFPTRRNQNAGPTVATPDAQCQGPHRFRYAVMPFAGKWLDADVKQMAQAWSTPPMVVQGVEDLQTPGGRGLIESTNPSVSITAIKRHETRDTLVVRLYNQTAESVQERLRLGRPARNAWTTDLLERRESPVAVETDQEVSLALGPHQVVTVEIEFA